MRLARLLAVFTSMFALSAAVGCGGGGGGGGGVPATVPTPPSITTSSLPGGTAGTAYSESVTATLGTTPYTWTISAGALPAGLTIAGSGTPSTTISGTPAAAGLASFTVQVTDNRGVVATRALSIDVAPAPGPVVITTASLPGGTTGLAYSEQITATGGTLPFSWSVSAGTLPTGLALAVSSTRTVTLAGTPSAAGTFNFTVQANDSLGQSDTQAYTVVIALPVPVVITTGTLPGGTAGAAYSQQITATGGTLPFTWSVTSGTLPTGTALGASTTRDVTLSGTPTVAGTASFTIRATDSLGAFDEESYSVAVAPGGPRVVFMADLDTPTVKEIYVTTIVGSTITAIHRASPDIQVNGDVTNGSYLLSPDGKKLAIRGDFTIDGVDELWVVDVSGAVPATATARRATPDRVATGTAGVNGAAAGIYYWSPDSTKISFRHDTDIDDVFEFYVADVSGTGPIVPQKVSGPLGLVSGRNVEPPTNRSNAFSFDSTHVAFEVDAAFDGGSEVFVADVSGPTPTTPQRVNTAITTANQDADIYYWHPGANTLIFLGDTESGDNNFELTYVTVAAGVPSNRTRLHPALVASGDVVSNQTLGLGAAFDPTGTKFVFLGDIATNDKTEVWITTFTNGIPNAPFTGIPAQLATADVDGWVVSDDGTKLITLVNQTTTKREIHFTDISTGTPGPTTRVNPAWGSLSFISGSGPDGNYGFIPNGTRAWYRADQDTDGIEELYLVDVANLGTSQKVNQPLIAAGDVLTDTVFSADSTRVAYKADANVDGEDELFFVDISGATPGVPVRAHPILLAGGDTFEPLFSADSKYLIYRGDVETADVIEMYFIDVTSPTASALKINPPIAANADVTSFILE